jgi:hypothetical protein
VGVKQIPLDLELDLCVSRPWRSFPSNIHEELVRLMARTILAVRQAGTEVGRDHDCRES